MLKKYLKGLFVDEEILYEKSLKSTQYVSSFHSIIYIETTNCELFIITNIENGKYLNFALNLTNGDFIKYSEDAVWDSFLTGSVSDIGVGAKVGLLNDFISTILDKNYFENISESTSVDSKKIWLLCNKWFDKSTSDLLNAVNNPILGTTIYCNKTQEMIEFDDHEATLINSEDFGLKFSLVKINNSLEKYKDFSENCYILNLNDLNFLLDLKYFNFYIYGKIKKGELKDNIAFVNLEVNGSAISLAEDTIINLPKLWSRYLENKSIDAHNNIAVNVLKIYNFLVPIIKWPDVNFTANVKEMAIKNNCLIKD